MPKELAVKQETGVSFSQEEVETIKNTVAKDATDTELKLFLMQCKRTGLDPFSRQIYFLKMGGKASIQSSIDGFRLIAERSDKYQGQTTPQYLDNKGVWHEVWTAQGYPVAAKVGVYKRDFKEPLYAIAKWSSYAPIYNGKVGTMWAKMPEVMLAKVAEALALRKAFPNDLSGIYSAEEMNQARATEEYDQTPIEADAEVVSTGDDLESAKPEPPKVVSELRQKKEIKDMIDGIVLHPLDQTAEAYEEYIMENCGVKLVPENYDFIIMTLSKKSKGEDEPE